VLTLAIFLFPPAGLQLKGEALDVIGRQLEQLFHYSNIEEFLLQPSESGQCCINCLYIIPSVAHPDPFLIRIRILLFILIRIRIRLLDPDPDPYRFKEVMYLKQYFFYTST
jgi:hypothetical protein